MGKPAPTEIFENLRPPNSRILKKIEYLTNGCNPNVTKSGPEWKPVDFTKIRPIAKL